jgi:hypothetical protein
MKVYLRHTRTRCVSLLATKMKPFLSTKTPLGRAGWQLSGSLPPEPPPFFAVSYGDFGGGLFQIKTADQM